MRNFLDKNMDDIVYVTIVTIGAILTFITL